MGGTEFIPAKGENVFEVDCDNSKSNKHSLTPLKVNGDTCSDFGPANKPREPKIYVVIENNKIIYIGGTRSSLRARLYSGLNHPKYHYKWRDVTGPLKLVVFVIPREYDNQESSRHTPKGIEAIEGEIAYMVRLSGGWPEHQTEIHFHSTKDITRRNARAIAEYLKSNGLAENIDLERYE